MKLTSWIIRLLPIGSCYLGIGLVAPPVVAQCIQADISVQYNISGSKQSTSRTNDIELATNSACRGNASVTTGVQGNVGGNGRVHQTRVVRHRIENQTDSNLNNSTVQIQSNPAIDVYNAADNLDN